MATCTNYFYAEDENGNYPSAVDPEIIIEKWNGTKYVIVGAYTIPSYGLSITLEQGTTHTAQGLVPVGVEDDWEVPRLKTFTPCQTDVTIVWKRICPDPTVSITAVSNSNPASGETVNFTSYSSGGTGHSIVSRKWDFGDGTSSTSANTSKAWTNTTGSPITYTVKFTATNDCGKSKSTTTTIRVSSEITNTGIEIQTTSGLNGKELMAHQAIELVSGVWWTGPALTFGHDMGRCTWNSINSSKKYSVLVGGACQERPLIDGVGPEHPDICSGTFGDGDKVIILARSPGFDFRLYGSDDVHTLSETSFNVVYLGTTSGDLLDGAYDFILAPICKFFLEGAYSVENCRLFVMENVFDVVFLANQIKIITEHKDIYGEDHPPAWYDYPLAGVALFGVLSPGISEGSILSNVGKKISNVCGRASDFAAREAKLIHALAHGKTADVENLIDAFNMGDWTTFDAAYNAIKSTPIPALDSLKRLKNWVDEIYKRGYAPKGSADELAKKSGILKRYAQKSVDYIRTKAPWIPGGQHGDDVSGVLTDAELPAFREMMDEITTYFAEKGEYTRYIDPGEMAIYFKENPEFFKQGYTNALMKTTSHFDNAADIGNAIKPLNEAEAAVRRAEWHMFIDDLQQGLINKFGDIRGKQLFDELGLKAARDAKEINKIIFKWGHRMWDNVYGAAKSAGATDEQAEALAKIAAESHINIGNGIASGAYKNQWQTKKGVIGWMQRHPLYTVVLGVGGLGYLTRMIPWYLMDNMPFNIWIGKEAGVIEKSFGDQEEEIVRMITTLGYQLRENPCNTTVQTNYVELLTLLKELKDIADSTDPVPSGVIPHFKSIYEVVYGVSIGVPNEYMRTRVKIDYSTAYTEYVLRVTEAGCTNPIEPPDGWDGVTGTGSIKCTSDLVCLLYLDDLYIGTVYPAGFVIAGVEPGSHTVKMTYSGEPDCVKTVTVVGGRQAAVECLFELPCILPVPSITAPSKATEKESVSFKGSATTESVITWWSWDFGDGGKSTIQNPSHTYFNAGNYLVQLTVTDDCGTVTTTHTIVIEEEEPPVEEVATVYVEMPIDISVDPPKTLLWNTYPEVYVDGQYERKVPGSIAFGGFGQPEVKGCTLMVRATGYQDTSKWFDLKDKDSLTWIPEMYPIGYVPPVPKGEITGYLAPPTAKQGDAIVVDATVKNIGAETGEFFCTLFEGETKIISSLKYTLLPGQSAVMRTGGTMPNHDWNLMVKVFRDGETVEDDVVAFTVKLSAVTFQVNFYLPDGASLTATKRTKVSRLVTGMRRIGRR